MQHFQTSFFYDLQEPVRTAPNFNCSFCFAISMPIVLGLVKSYGVPSTLTISPVGISVSSIQAIRLTIEIRSFHGLILNFPLIVFLSWMQSRPDILNLPIIGKHTSFLGQKTSCLNCICYSAYSNIHRGLPHRYIIVLTIFIYNPKFFLHPFL